MMLELVLRSGSLAPTPQAPALAWKTITGVGRRIRRGRRPKWRHPVQTTSTRSGRPRDSGRTTGGSLMVPSGLTSTVIGRASLGVEYERVRDRGLLAAVSQFLYDEAALLDEWRLDEWLALFHPEATEYLIPSPEDLSDDPATTLHLVHDSMTMLAGRVTRLKSKHAHAESPRSRTRRQIANVRVWQGPSDLFVRSVFDVIRVRGGAVDRYVGVYEHQLLPNNDGPTPWLIGRRRVLIDHNIEAGGGSLAFLL
jgi:p-cumate 2,3-dioxygenase beta subunit